METLNRHCTILTGILILLLSTTALAASRPIVMAVNYPLAYFGERIGGDLVNLVFPAPAGVDPAFWMPEKTIIGDFQRADLILLNGAGYAKWTKKTSLPMLRTVDTSKSFKDNLISIDTEVTHSHGPGGDHSHSGTAFTTWLDFSLAARQAEAVYQALARLLPAHEAELRANFARLESDLLDLDSRVSRLSERRPGMVLLGSHPVYQYLARGYDLDIRMVMWEPDEDPGEAQYDYLQKMAEDLQASWMLWEASPRPESIARLEEMGISSLVYSPCFNRPEEGDFLTIMTQNVDRLEAVFNRTD